MSISSVCFCCFCALRRWSCHFHNVITILCRMVLPLCLYSLVHIQVQTKDPDGRTFASIHRESSARYYCGTARTTHKNGYYFAYPKQTRSNVHDKMSMLLQKKSRRTKTIQRIICFKPPRDRIHIHKRQMMSASVRTMRRVVRSADSRQWCIIIMCTRL